MRQRPTEALPRRLRWAMSLQRGFGIDPLVDRDGHRMYWTRGEGVRTELGAWDERHGRESDYSRGRPRGGQRASIPSRSGFRPLANRFQCGPWA